MRFQNARSRDFERRVAAADKARKAKTLDTKGITDPMWNMLQQVHLARLTPERALSASPTQPQLQALHRRGLVTWSEQKGELAQWTTTPAGADIMKKGRPE